MHIVKGSRKILAEKGYQQTPQVLSGHLISLKKMCECGFACAYIPLDCDKMIFH